MQAPRCYDHGLRRGPAPRILIPRSRALVLVGLFLLTLAAIGSVSLVADEAASIQVSSHSKRQFQLGAIRAHQADPSAESTVAAVNPQETQRREATETESPHNESSMTSLPITPRPVVTTEIVSPVPVKSEDGSKTTRTDDAAVTQLSQSPSLALLDALIEALKKVVKASVIQSGPESTTTIGSSAPGAPEQITREAPKASLMSSLTPSTTGRPMSPGIDKSPSWNLAAGLLGGLAGRNTRPGDEHLGSTRRIRARDTSSIPGNQAVSLLGPFSDMVAQAVPVDAGAAARLMDVILDALPVDAEALASAIPQVAEQASVKTVDLLPLTLPAIAAALGKHVDQHDPVGLSHMSEALQNIVTQGIMVINKIMSTTGTALQPNMQAIIDQVAAIVYAAANRLGEPLCAIGQNAQGAPLESIAPCSSAVQGPASASANVVTLNPGTAATGIAAQDTTSRTMTSVASPQAYGPSQSQPPSVASSASTTCADSQAATVTAATLSDAEQTASEVQQGASPGGSTTASSAIAAQPHTQMPASSPSLPVSPTFVAPASTGAKPTSCSVAECPSCPPCPAPLSQSVNASPSENEAGPCPGRGFRCADCLNGWFCPPQETPAQVVPCGLGWPCFHCKSGWYCVSEIAPASTMQPTRPAEQPPRTSASAASTGSAAVPGDVGARAWKYLGCFEDAINRTLVGSRPLDYLRGNMSSGTCIDHCASKSYSFGGTECGTECWCGSSIRDDAVRLPESSCGTACSGEETQRCGGSWAISVFVDPNAYGQPDAGKAPAGPAPAGPAPAGAGLPDGPSGSPPSAEGNSTTTPVTSQPPASVQPVPAQSTPQDYGPVARLVLKEALVL